MNIELLYLLASGFLGGLLAGLLGIGGGVIYILILPLILSNAGVCESEIVKYTIANSVFAIFIASLSGNVINYIKKRLYFKEITFIGVPASILSILGMYFIVNREWYSKPVFDIVVLTLLIFMLGKMLMKVKGIHEEKKLSNNVLGMIGGASGLVSALSGLGGGILVVPMLQAFYHFPIKKAKDISLGVIGIMAFSLSVFNFIQTPNCVSNEYQAGLIVLPTIMVLVLGVLIGSPIGVWVATKLQSRHIKFIFILMIISVIIRKVIEII